MQFRAKFSWVPETENEINIKQIVFAGDRIYKERCRHDCVQYMDANAVRQIGIIQSLFQHKQAAELRVDLIRRLCEVSPEIGNENLSLIYGNRRFQYFQKNTGDCLIDVVPSFHFRRIFMIVPDMYDISKRYGASIRVQNIPDSKAERALSRFFEVRDYQFTSIAESFA